MWITVEQLISHMESLPNGAERIQAARKWLATRMAESVVIDLIICPDYGNGIDGYPSL